MRTGLDMISLAWIQCEQEWMGTGQIHSDQVTYIYVLVHGALGDDSQLGKGVANTLEVTVLV